MLTLEQVERILACEKEDWQRKVNQGVLKAELNQSISALGAMGKAMTALGTDYKSLQKFWDMEAGLDEEHKTQFRNALISKLSGMIGREVWEEALREARDCVIRNLKAKSNSSPDATGNSSDVRAENFLRSSRA